MHLGCCPQELHCLYLNRTVFWCSTFGVLSDVHLMRPLSSAVIKERGPVTSIQGTASRIRLFYLSQTQMDGEPAAAQWKCEDTSAQTRRKQAIPGPKNQIYLTNCSSHLCPFCSFTIELVAVIMARIRLLRSFCQSTTVFYNVCLTFSLARNLQW